MIQSSMIKRSTALVSLVFSMLVYAPALAQTVVERSDLLGIFEQHGLSGTFVALDLKKDRLIVVNPKRAYQRFIPASTFKIFNSLIALEVAAVKDENEVVPYGGKPQIFKSWEQDMSIRQAIKVSNVPVYQEIARRVGLERYRSYLQKLGFGNRSTGELVETFWLEGPLKISAVEYVHLLKDLALFKLDASVRNQKIVADITRFEVKNGVALHGKTGWTQTPDPDLGWFVGWVQNNDRVVSFALNLDIHQRGDARKRITVTKALLAALNYY